MLNPWVLLGIVVAWIGSLVAVGVWQNDLGHTEERVTWQGEQITQLTVAKAEIERLNNDARAKEAAGAAQQAAIGADYEKRLQDAEAQRAADVAAARSGRIVMRIPGACPAAGGSGAPTTSTPAVGGDGRTTGELPGPIAADLLGLADDADRNTKQLTACQSVVNSYLKGSP